MILPSELSRKSSDQPASLIRAQSFSFHRVLVVVGNYWSRRHPDLFLDDDRHCEINFNQVGMYLIFIPS